MLCVPPFVLSAAGPLCMYVIRPLTEIKATPYAGIYNLGKLREEGKAAQGQLSDLNKLLKEMSQQIQDHSSLKLHISAEEWGKP